MSIKKSATKSAKKSKGIFGGMSFGAGFGGGSAARAPLQKAAPVKQVEKAAKSGGGIFSSFFGSKGSKPKKSEPIRSEMMSDAMDCMQDE